MTTNRLDRTGVARLLGITDGGVDRLCARDPSFPRPTIEAGKAVWWRSEIETWRGTKWLRQRPQIFY